MRAVGQDTWSLTSSGLVAAMAEPRARPTARAQRPPASILSVIRDPLVRDRLMELCMEAGYGVYCATGALEALAVLGRERPGAVLVEAEMESGAGVRFLDIFRRLTCHEDVLCLVVTGRPALPEMTGVTVLQKPDLAGLEGALARHFEPDAASSSK